jgi:anion-transporting  ArsA/GET3 family ATPase
MSVASLEQLRFVFITGKGGVGKTTTTAALALALAARGRRVLIALAEAKERLSTLFGVPPLGTDIGPVAPNIHAVRITPEVALREYGHLILKNRALHGALFDNKYVKSFFSAVPALNEWSILGKAWYHATETDAAGSPRFDVVLFDAPATGHGLELLRVPKTIVEIVPPGVLRRDAERAWTMFQDPQQTGVVLVTLPEEMPTNETVELAGALQQELALPVAQIVVNGTLEPLFSEPEAERLLALRGLAETEPGDAALMAGARRALRERVQRQSLERLGQLGVPLLELPLLYRDAATPAAISELSRRLLP